MSSIITFTYCSKWNHLIYKALIIDLWKSVLITGKVKIGGAATQMELRGVTDKRMLYLVVGGR